MFLTNTQSKKLWELLSQHTHHEIDMIYHTDGEIELFCDSCNTTLIFAYEEGEAQINL